MTTNPTDQQLLIQIYERQCQLITKIGELNLKIEQLEAELVTQSAAYTSLFAMITSSMPKKPDGSPDLEGHANYHSMKIQESREGAELYRQLRKEILTKGVIGTIGVIGFLAAFWWNNGRSI